MRLKLKNFKCYDAVEFDFPDNGLCLLTGQSGAGKSTLLKAILFALYGAGAVKKPYTYGKTTCSVSLDFLGLKITRTSRPNRLCVDGCEDEAAQHIINKKLGLNQDQFEISSFIHQKNNKCILSVQPTEQTRLIKTLQENVVDYREKIKKLEAESSRKKQKLQIKYKILKEQINKADIQPIEFPLKNETGSEEEILERYDTFLTGYADRVKLLNEKREKHIKNINDITQRNQSLQLITEQIKSSKKQIEEYNNMIYKDKIELNNIPENIKEEIEIIDSKIRFIEKENSIKSKLTDINNRIEKMTKKKATINKNFWTKNEAEESIKNLEELKELKIKKDLADKNERKFKRIQKRYNLSDRETIISKITELYESLIIKKQTLNTKPLICPCCNNKICLSNGKLFKYSTIIDPVIKKEEYDEKIKVIYADLGFLNGCLFLNDQMPNNLEDKLNDLLTFVEKNKLAERELYLIDKNMSELQADAGRISKEKNNESNPCVDETIEKLRNKVYEFNMKNLKRNDVLKRMETNNIFLSRIYGRLEAFKRDEEKLNNLEIQDEVKEISKKEKLITKIEVLNSKYDKYIKLADVINKYKIFKMNKKKYGELTQEYQNVKENFKIKKNENLSFQTLLDLYKKAEKLSLENLLFNINEYTRNFLEQFFSENLNIYLKCKDFKIMTQIQYKGYDYDSIRDLSGGEFDRCVLASVCGLNAFLNSPILILDEALSSLDMETNTRLMQCLKKIAENKLVIVCAHNTIEGIFTNVKTL